MEVDAPVLPEELRAVPRAALEKYVFSRIRQFSRVFVGQLLGPDASSLPVEAAYNQACQLLSSSQQQLSSESFVLRFTHACKFLGCMNKECQLCANNPNKRCRPNDNFDECYADNQVLKSKCDADVFVQLLSETTGRPADMSGLEVQVSVIDGESTSGGSGNRPEGWKELLRSDEGQVLLGSHTSGIKSDGCGRLLVKLQDGSSRLPDVFVTDKTDTFHMDAHTYSSFRLMARAFQRDLYGNAVLLDHIAPAVSEKFIVKTQRALNDYRKSEYPHYKDELTKLKFIGSITAQRLRDIQAHIAADVPFTSIETVEQLKHLMLYADQNRQVENKLLELLNMKGKHKHKWDYLREILLEKIVYDDMVHRAWYADETMMQGLLFACKQGQVNLEKPFGIAQRVVSGGQSRLQVLSPGDTQSQELLKLWRSMAEEAWNTPSHMGWSIVTEALELVGASTANARQSSAGQMSMGLPNRPSLTEAVQGLVKRESVLSPHQSMGYPAGAASAARAFHAQSMSGPETASAFPFQGINTSNSVGTPGDGTTSRPFQFTATRSLRITAHERGSSGSNTPRSESGVGGLPTAFGHMGRLTLDPEVERVASAPGFFPQRSAPDSGGRGQHPFAHFPSVFGVQQELESQALRVSSSPDVYAQAPHSVPHSPSVGKSSLGLDLSNSDSPRPRGAGPSRIRRMSATDASVAQKLQAMQPLDRGVDLNALAKRPRASVIPPDGTGQDQAMESVYDTAPVRSPSNMQLYHSESRGRHHPRSRMSIGEPDMLDPDARHAASREAVSNPVPNPLDIDDLLVDATVPPLSILRADPALSQLHAEMGGPHPHSPSQFLSSTMQHALQLDEGQHQLSSGNKLTGFAQQNAWRQLEGAGADAKMQPMAMACDADALNRNLARTLKHAESDSFKRMLDVFPLPSPPHNTETDNVADAQAFQAFLDDHFSDTLPS